MIKGGRILLECYVERAPPKKILSENVFYSYILRHDERLFWCKLIIRINMRINRYFEI